MRPLPILLAVALAAAAASSAAAGPKPVAEVVFKGSTPEAVAPRLASECTRRRMALIRNTPERVVCRRTVAAKARDAHGVNELWSFVLDRMSRGRTKVRARPSFEVATAQGYAVMSFKEFSPESRDAMRGFMEDVRAGGLSDTYRR